tara:strand:- start:866 stop:1762 length:897 start_codon:yes stop_codon:yes gene_type:complete
MKIVLCICFSIKNASHHKKILNNLNEIKIPPGCKLSFYLITNDNFEILKNLASTIVKNHKFEIKIFKTTKKDIPSTRNIFLKEIQNKKIDYIGFLDDDCKIKNNWVFDMVKFIKKNDCQIVGGPQLHETRIHKYKSFYQFMEPEYAHKQTVNWIATNNCFFKKEILNETNLKFDEELKNIGGSDQLFFTKLKKAEYEIKWNENAKVTEYYQKNRENFKWFIIRNFRYGYSGLIIDQKIFGKKIGHIINLMKMVYLLLLSLIQIVQIFKSYNVEKSLFYLSRATGRIFSVTKFRMKKYR